MCRQVFHHPRKQSSSRHNSDLGRQMPSLWMSSPFLFLPPSFMCWAWCHKEWNVPVFSGGKLAQLGPIPSSCATLAVWQVRPCRSVGQRECEEWKLWLFWLGRCMCTVTLFEQIHGAAAAGNQTDSFLRGWGTWDMTCSSVTRVKRAAGSDDPGSHSFATSSSAHMLLISLIEGARQGCLARQQLDIANCNVWKGKGLPMKKMWYLNLLITFKFPQVLLLALNLYLLCLHLSNSSSAARKMAVTSFLWS